MDRACVSSRLLLFCFWEPAQHFFRVVAATEYYDCIKPSCLKAEGCYSYWTQETIGYGAKGSHPMILIEITPIAVLLLLPQGHAQIMRTQLRIFLLAVHSPTDPKTFTKGLHAPSGELLSAMAVPVPAQRCRGDMPRHSSKEVRRRRIKLCSTLTLPDGQRFCDFPFICNTSSRHTLSQRIPLVL